MLYNSCNKEICRIIIVFVLCFLSSTERCPHEGSTSVRDGMIFEDSQSVFCFIAFFVVSYSNSSLPTLTSNLCWILISALTLPTLSLCHAANTSGLLLGWRPANLFTLRKHKQIDKLHGEADNPSFHLHSRLSSVTGILSPVSSLVARWTNRSLAPLLPVIVVNMHHKPLTSDLQV